jgi:hypothetical protein
VGRFIPPIQEPAFQNIGPVIAASLKQLAPAIDGAVPFSLR